MAVFRRNLWSCSLLSIFYSLRISYFCFSVHEGDGVLVGLPYSDQCKVAFYRGVQLISVIPFNCFPVEELVAGLFGNLCVCYAGAFNDSLFVERFGVAFVQEEGDGVGFDFRFIFT